MNRTLLLLSLLAISSVGYSATIKNKLIDWEGFEKIVSKKNIIREKKRLTERQFIQAMKEEGVILLDARSKKNYDLRHIVGAVNLPFTEVTAESLRKVIPEKNSKILIYCNNNFLNSPVSFASKKAPASLNVFTQVNLSAYGYENVFELGPLLDVRTTKIPFAGTECK